MTVQGEDKKGSDGMRLTYKNAIWRFLGSMFGTNPKNYAATPGEFIKQITHHLDDNNYGTAMYAGATKMTDRRDSSLRDINRKDLSQLIDPKYPFDQRIEALKQSLKNRIVPGDFFHFMLELLRQQDTHDNYHVDLPNNKFLSEEGTTMHEHFLRQPEVTKALLEVAQEMRFPRSYASCMHAAVYTFMLYQQNHPNPDFDFTPMLNSVYQAAANSDCPESRDAAARFIFVFDRYNPDYQPTPQQEAWLEKYRSYRDHGIDGNKYVFKPVVGPYPKFEFYIHAPANRWPLGHKNRINTLCSELWEEDKVFTKRDAVLSLKQLEKDYDVYFQQNEYGYTKARDYLMGKSYTEEDKKAFKEPLALLWPLYHIMRLQPAYNAALCGSDVFTTDPLEAVEIAGEAYRIMTKYIPDTEDSQDLYKFYHYAVDKIARGDYDKKHLKWGVIKENTVDFSPLYKKDGRELRTPRFAGVLKRNLHQWPFSLNPYRFRGR